jgi:N-acetylmuramic acid 6-phosphate etherase
MIRLGRVEDNKMVNMQLTNAKLVDRGVMMVMKELQLPDYATAKSLLLKYGSVKKAINHGK